MRFRILLSASMIAIAGTALAAGPQLKPGQWENQVSMQMAGMPQLSAEQLAQMKQMGIDLPFLSGKPTIIQQCITPEQAALQKPLNPSANPNDMCTIRNYRKSGKTVSGEVVCTGELKAQGRFEMTVESDTSYKGKWTMKGVSGDGQPIDQTTEIQARWVKAKCDPGAVAVQ
ncbi:MAG TPA: DUF3617 domain-containing protein [Methylophilaceae bacterium]|jgi:hypothetical protein